MHLSTRNDVRSPPKSDRRHLPRIEFPTGATAPPPLTSGYGVVIEKEEKLLSTNSGCLGAVHGGHGSDLRRILHKHQSLLESNLTLLRRRCEELPHAARFETLYGPSVAWPRARGSAPAEEEAPSLADLVSRHASLIGDIDVLVDRSAIMERDEPLLAEMERNHEDMAWMLTALVNEDERCSLPDAGTLPREEEIWENEGGGPPDGASAALCIYSLDTSFTPDAAGEAPGLAARRRVSERTKELAVLAGRVPPQVDQCDYEQAKREATGETDGDLQDAKLDAPLHPRPSAAPAPLE